MIFNELVKSFKDELLIKARSMEKIRDMQKLDQPIAKLLENTGEYVDYRNCPTNGGRWENKDGTEGKRGDSKWKPDGNYVPQKSNPEGKNWDKTMDKYGIDGINFNKGEPDFSEVCKGEVTIDNFSSDRSDNFDQADKKLAEQRGCTPQDVAKWRKEHGYTWHECKDMKTMQKVPNDIHGNIPHRGGIANSKGA